MHSVYVSLHVEGKSVRASLIPIIWEDWITYGLLNERVINISGAAINVVSNLIFNPDNSVLLFNKAVELESFLNITCEYPKAAIIRENVVVKCKTKHKNCAVLYVPPCIEITREAHVDICVSTQGYSYMKDGGIQCCYWEGIDRENYLLRFKHDVSMISSLLEVGIPSDIAFCIAKDITELRLLTGKTSTFVYQNKLIGLVYSEGKNRSDVHELTHYLLSGIGTPTYLFIEGMAVLVCDLLVRKKWGGLLLSEKITARFDPKDKQLWIRLMFSSKFSYENARKEMDLTAAAFLTYIYRHYGLSALKRCYSSINYKNSDETNETVLVNVFGKRLKEITDDWLNMN